MSNNLIEPYKATKNKLKMWIFTIVGVIYFMVPFQKDGETQMWISYIEGLVVDSIKCFPLIMVIVFTAFAIISIIFSTVLKNKIDNDFISSLFQVKAISIIWRIAGAAILIDAYWKIGPEFIWSPNTGGLMVFDLIPMLFMLFLLALPLIGLLTDFGGLELIGGILKPLFKPLFRLSGKAAVLSLVSYIGSGTTGMIVTDQAHKRGGFTTREANIIVFGFAIVSFPVTFAYPTGIAGLNVEYFPALTLCLVACTIVCAVIISRIPPLSRKANTYYNGEQYKEEERGDKGLLSLAYEDALKKAASAPSVKKLLGGGFKEFCSFVIDIFPVIITVATLVLALSEYTIVFDIIAKPIAPILELMNLPEATKAAPAFVLGFADLFLPFIGATAVTSQFTKFVICAVAIMQIYCMSEGAIVLMKSSMKINFGDIVVIFIMRTIISTPIAILFATLFSVA